MKTVLITGGSKGLGNALANTFLRNGYKVIITYNTSKILNNNMDVVKLDITNEEEIVNLFNNYKIDILINNAAICMDSELLDKTKDEFMRVLEVNLVGTFLMCKYAIMNNVKEIINISSTDSINTFNNYNIDYSSSKAGVNIITKAIALFYNDVRIIGILPNYINTESVLEMNREYLDSELKRIKQEELLDKDEVSKSIFEIYKNKDIKSGSLIRIDYEGGLCTKILE